MDHNGDMLALSRLPAVNGAKVLASGAPVDVSSVKGGIVLHLPEARDEADTVVVLETQQ
jgi:hypothetical protein